MLLAVAILWRLWRRNVVRPASFKEAGRDLSGASVLKLTIAAVATFFGQQFAATAAAAVVLEHAADLSGPISARQEASITIFATLVALACAFVAIVFVREGTRRDPAGFCVRPRARDVAQGALYLLASAPIILTASFLAGIAFYFITGHPPEIIAHDTLKIIQREPGNPGAWGLIAAAVVFGPMVEELLFRVFMQSAIVKATGLVWPSIVVTSLLFAAAHLGGGVKVEAAQALFPLFVLSLCLGIAYERTGRMWVPITMHMLFNAVNVAATLAM